MKKIVLFIIGFSFHWTICTAQNATIKGIVLDELKKPIENAHVWYDDQGTYTNSNGVYELQIPANTLIDIQISFINYKNMRFSIRLEPNQVYELNPVLKIAIEQIGEVVISGRERKVIQGLTTIDPETIRVTPSANAGVESLLKSLPGVSSNNELSTQYAVRGGNYDENLVYVNEIEVYRPFLIRSGQQEGLSFVNTDLVRDVEFSAGGFQAKYGDKLSSVLDITYRRPTRFNIKANASLLGGSLTVGSITKNKKFAMLTGLRYRDNSLLVNARETETNFRPRFTDLQTNISYAFTNKFELSFLGNIAINRYDYEPITRQTNFGTLINPIALTIFYQGQEDDRYRTFFGAFKGTYKPNDNLNLRFIASGYHTQEQEHFDILAAYFLGTVNTDIGDENVGEVEFNEGIGSQLTHARNDLDALIFNASHRGTFKKGEHQIDWGVKFTHEDIRDRLQEYEIIDSAGFSLRPLRNEFINDQPYRPFASPIVPFTSVRARNNVTINRLSGFAQYSVKTQLGKGDFWANVGIRTHQWLLQGDNLEENTQSVISPRAQIAFKPDWEADMIFRFATGYYHQPPFYRELRDLNGVVQPNVNAQRAIHFVIGHDYSFTMWQRPFKLTSEIYYKDLDNVNTYTIENVRIRYRANNNATAYATGLDMRLHGEFIPGTESWISLGLLKTQENQDQRGFIDRPTDQRVKVGMLFQDYVPTLPNLKMYLNLVYQTGFIGGSPTNADPYDFQSRLRDYRRADLGISYVVLDQNSKSKPKGIFKNLSFLELGFEIFNMFNTRNSITNTFVRDIASQLQFAVPNILTPRIYNFKLDLKF